MVASASVVVQSQTTSTPVTYVYVSSAPTSSTFEINAYAAFSNGSLAKVTGSPFAAKVQYLALNGKWLFGTNGVDIYSFAIQSNGALRDGPSVNAQAFNQYPTDGGPQNLFLDHTGQSLYDGDIYIDGANNGYQSWKIVGTTGQLDFAGKVGPYSPSLGSALSFLANNVYGYSAGCYKGSPNIYGYKRGSTGTLTALNIRPSIPPTNIAGSGYCPYLAAADRANHVAVSLTPFAPFYFTGPPQIAVYTANTSGSLTTTSTASNMPKSAVGQVTFMNMAPSGKLLAVAGSGGLQVFHFNGPYPVTKYTGLLTTSKVDQMFWDNANHLYAVSKSAGKLYVFTVTPTYVAQASGSPHSIYHPQNISVLPKTPLP
jgi:hypothetical protein